MSNSTLPKWMLQDTDGAPIVGGTFEFFEAGTSTPKNVYSDSDRSVSLGDTLTTDSRGEVGPVYIDTAAASKCVAKDSSGNTLWTIDNLTPPGGLTSSLTGYSVSPLDYGAIGDGAADESSEVQSALDNALGDVNLANKTYRCDSQLDVSDGTVIRNGTIDATQSTAGNVFSVNGTVESPDLLTANSNSGDSTVTIADTTDYSVGDYVLVKSTDFWETGNTGRGEIMQVKSLTSTVLTFAGQLKLDHLTSDGASVSLLTFKKNIRFENVHILCAYASAQSAIYVNAGHNVVVRDCSVDDVKDYGVELQYSVACRVDGLEVRESGAGVFVGNAVLACDINRVVGVDCTYAVQVGAVSSTDGLCESVSVRDTYAEGCTVGISVDGIAINTLVDGLVCKGCPTGLSVSGINTTARHVSVSHPSTRGVIIAPSVGRSITVSSDNNQPDFVLDDVYVEFSAGDGVVIDNTGSGSRVTDGVHLSKIRVAGAAGHGINVSNASGSRLMNDLSIHGLSATNTAAAKKAIFIDCGAKAMDGVAISNVQSDGGVEIDADDNDDVTGVSLRNVDCDGGIDLQNCKGVAIVGCRVDDSAEALSQCVLLTNCNSVTVSGCELTGVTGVSHVASTAGATFSDIIINGCAIQFTSGSGVSLAVSGTGALDRSSVNGCTISPYGAQTTQVAGVSIVGGTNLAKRVSVTNNCIKCLGSAGDGVGVQVTGDNSHVSVCGNNIESNGDGIEFGTTGDDTLKAMVCNNIIEQVGALTVSDGVSFNGDNVDYALVAGNFVYGFYYAFHENCTAESAIMLGNNFATEWSNAFSSGTFYLGTSTTTAADIKNGSFVTPP